MPISGNAEPEAVSGQQQVQRQLSINLSTAIPIKKRRFPIFQPSSPSPEEQSSGSENQDSKNKQESNISDEGLSVSNAINTASPGVSKISASVVKKEDNPTNVELGRANVESSGSKSQEAKPIASLGSLDDDLGNKTNLVLNEKKSCELQVSESCVGANTNVKQEIVGGPSGGKLEISKGLMNVELSLGLKEISDPPLLLLGLSEEKANDNGSAIGSVSANRSNWDLNTTMDVWEGSANRIACIDQDKSSLTSAGTIGLSLNKRKFIVDDPRSDSFSAYMKPSKQCKADDSSLTLGLGMAGRELDASQTQKNVPLSDTCFSTSVNAKLNLGNRSVKPVKPEPVDENSKRDCSISKRDCSIGSCGSTNTGLLKFSSVKRELVNNSSVTPDLRSIKSEVVQDDNQEACARIMQHQESSASSSALPVSPVPHNLCPSKSQHSFHSKGGSHASKLLKPCVNSSVVDSERCKLARVDENTSESCLYEEASNDGEKINTKTREDEEYEDGEVREHMERSIGEDPIVEGEKKTDNSEVLRSEFEHVQQPSVVLGTASDLKGEYSVMKNDQDEIGGDPNILDQSERKAIDENSLPGEEVSGEKPTTDNDDNVKENCFGENVSTLSNAEASFDGHDSAKEAHNISNKSRIINLSRPSDVTTPRKTTFIPNRLLTSRNGKERFSDPDGEIQPRSSRNETYNGGSNKFAKGRIHDQSFRNSRPGYMRGKGRMSGRFGSSRNEWNSDHDFGSDTSYGPSDYRAVRHKHPSEMEIECNDYRIPQDGNAMGNRRKPLNDEFPSLRRNSLRRDPPGERDGPSTRGNQMLRRLPRNIESSSDVIGLRHGDKFMRHISDDGIDPVFSRPQGLYEELDGQLVRGNRNFSNMQRKGYPRIRSKSPDRPRTRSPGLWSPRRRSPNGLSELNQHRSPAMYRMGRMRSPDRSCFRDEMVDRRRGSPSYVDSGREHVVHPRSRRSSPSRVFPRGGRRGDGLDSREMGDGEEYINGPLQSNKFHGDGSVDERRKFVERRGGPVRSFRPNYNNDSDNFRFHMNDGPRPFRFCEEAEAEFVERNNMREREFDGHNEHMKHQSLVENRRIRNIEEQQEGNYRPVERIWHDEGFTDDRMKRRRF